MLMPCLRLLLKFMAGSRPRQAGQELHASEQVEELHKLPPFYIYSHDASL